VKEAKSGWLQGRQVTRAQDGSLASLISQELYLKRTLQWDAAVDEKVAALTHAQIQAAMKKHIDLSKIAIVKAGDFAKAAKK
jgi:zinc protease